MLTKKIGCNRCCLKYFIFFLSLLTTLLISIQTTTVQADVQNLPHHSDHHTSLPFSLTIAHGFNYVMLMFAITNFVTQSQSSYPNNALLSCPTNEKGLIPLGQENFTECLQKNASGHYLLVSPINFSNFSNEEKMHYPMYNITSPFKGALDTGDHYIADLYLNRIGMSALFGAIANSNFHVHFKNPYVIGTNRTAVLAAMARGHNTINMTVDHATAITVCPPHINCNSFLRPPSGFAAIVLGTSQGNNLSIYFRAQSTYTQTAIHHAHAGIVAAQIAGGFIDIDVNTNFSQLTTSGHVACAGAVGVYDTTCRSCNQFLKAQTHFNNISIFSKGIASASGSTVGCIWGHQAKQNIRLVNKINSKINTITIHASGAGSSIGTCIGLIEHPANIINLSVNDASIIGNNVHAGGVVGHIMPPFSPFPDTPPSYDNS